MDKKSFNKFGQVFTLGWYSALALNGEVGILAVDTGDKYHVVNAGMWLTHTHALLQTFRNRIALYEWLTLDTSVSTPEEIVELRYDRRNKVLTVVEDGQPIWKINDKWNELLPIVTAGIHKVNKGTFRAILAALQVM